MSELSIYKPASVEELVSNLGIATDRSKILSGGTDLIIAMNKGKVVPDKVIDISGIEKLKGIKKENDIIKIGAATVFSEISCNEFIVKEAQCLAEASSTVGSTQIRNMATLGGNIANLSAAADAVPALIILNATMDIINSKGEIREISVEKYLEGSKESLLGHDECIMSIKLPVSSENAYSSFAKIGSRNTVTIARLNLALRFDYNAESMIIEKPAVALGAVGKTAFRATEIESVLEGQVFSDELIKLFADKLSKEVEKAIPGRYSLPYKRAAIKGAAYDVFDKLRA
jgi:CO/xanthine dehydrogenase FAD-binding subunit